MPTIVQLGAFKISIYADDHVPPHFHLHGPDCNVLIEIESLRVLRGAYPRKALAMALEWAQANRPLLMAKWSEFNERD